MREVDLRLEAECSCGRTVAATWDRVALASTVDDRLLADARAAGAAESRADLDAKLRVLAEMVRGWKISCCGECGSCDAEDLRDAMLAKLRELGLDPDGEVR